MYAVAVQVGKKTNGALVILAPKVSQKILFVHNFGKYWQFFFTVSIILLFV